VSGLVLLTLVLTYQAIGPSLIAGAPWPSGSSDPSVVNSYFGHGALGSLVLVQFMTVPPFLLFFFSLRERLSGGGRARFWSTLGLMFVGAEVPLILGGAALQGALVSIASRGGDAFPLYRFWDLYWNSAAYLLEASFLFAFAFAMTHSASFPRWVARLSLVVGGLLGFNVFVVWTGLPPTAALPANLLFAVWFLTVSIGQLRLSRSDVPSAHTSAP